MQYLKILQYVSHLLAIANILGVKTPPVVGQALDKLTAVAPTLQGFTVPKSADEAIADAEKLLAAELAATGHEVADGHIETILAILHKSPTNDSTLASGQFAVIAITSQNFNGVADQVVIGAFRKSGAAAKTLGY